MPASLSDTVSTNLDGLECQFYHWPARAKRAAARWAFRAFPRLAGSALENAAAGFEPALIPFFFSTDVRQISPPLNDDLLELYGRAGQVLENRFAFFNSPQAFDEGITGSRPKAQAGGRNFMLAITSWSSPVRFAFPAKRFMRANCVN